MVFFENFTVDFENKLVLLDIDGTLTVDGSAEIFDAVKRKVEELKFVNKVFLCSNKHIMERDKAVENILAVNKVNFKYKKPNKKILSEIPGKINLPIMVIGDKMLTDGLFACRIKADLILVKRKISGQESFFIKLSYLIDNFIYRIIFFYESYRKG